MGDVFDQMAQSNNQNQSAAQTPAPGAEAPTHGTSGGDVFDQMAKDTSDPSGQNGHGASGSWEPNASQQAPQAPTKVGTMPHLSEVWEGINTPLIPDARPGSLADSAHKYSESTPTEFSMDHPKVAGTLKGLSGAVYDTIETLRSFTSPLAIGTLGLGELAEGSGAGAKIAKAAGRGMGAGFGAQGVQDAYEGIREKDIHKTLNGLGQALLSAAAELKGTKLDPAGKTNAAPAGTQGGDRTLLRPTTQTTAGVEAPIAASQQPEPSFLTKVLEKTTTVGKAAEFQEEHTKPAARRQAVSVLSQAAEDKIGAHDALVNGEAAPEQISGSQTPGQFMTPDEIWQEMQRSAGKTYDKARSISKQELNQWQEERTKAENEHKAAIERHNQLVDANNAELGEGEAPMDRLEYNADDVDSRERPKTYDELKSDLDNARDRLGRNNPSDVREKAKSADVPKAEKALDDWFKDHEDAIDGSEYQSAKSLWADSERFKDIANNLRGKLAKGTMTGNDIRGLEALVDGKAIKRRGAAGIGEYGRLLGPEATENLNTVAKLFDPLESTDPRSGMIRSWGSYVAKHVVATMMAPLFGVSYLGIEGINGLNELFMNHVMFDPEFGSSFARVVSATKAAISAGSKVPSAIWQPFKTMVSQIAQKYADSKFGGEEGAVSAGGVKRTTKVSPRAGAKPLAAELLPNGSGDSSASQEAINRDQSEKGQGLKRVVVDTRSGQERPLLGVDAVDYQAKPYESVEFRGGNRDGEVIDQGRSARPYQRKNAALNLSDASQTYAAERGMGKINTGKVPVDSKSAANIADDFEQMEHNPNDPRVKQSYDALKSEVKAQWDYATKKLGIKIEPTDTDPYGLGDKPAEQQLFDDVNKNKHLGVWRGGNPLQPGHPLTEVDPETGENYNTMLRAVHDIFGHAAEKNDFSEHGEENAWNLHRQMFSQSAVPAMTTETKGQTSWFFNNKGVRGGAPVGAFATQKAGLLPQYMKSHPVIDHIESGKPFAVLTAENPLNGRISDGENAKLNAKLVSQLRQDGYHPVEVEGHNQDVAGQKEHSFFVPDIDSAEAAKYGRQFKQSAILTQEGLHDLNKNTVVPSDNSKVMVGSEASQQPYYSTVNGTPFSVPLDFSKEILPKPAIKVGSAEATAADSAYVQQAKAELPNGSDSEVLLRAQELKQTPLLAKSEITTRRPKAVGADMNNNPGQHSNWEAVQQADLDSPSGVTALGKTKMGYKEKLARTVETYPGMPDVEDPAAPKDSDKILSKFVNHVSSNLEWLYNQVDPSIREKTRQWYDAAHEVVNEKAQSYGYSREQGAGVVAALSPQNPWDNNIGLADRVMDVYKNRQNFPFSPDMEKMAAELKQVPTQSQAFKKMLRDINGKKLKDIKNDNPDVQAVQRALWVRLYDEAHGNPVNDQYAPTGEVVGKSPDTRSWIGLDHLSKAVKILDDGSVDNINSVMGQGHKIRNFYNNIINPMSKSGHTTIDTHAVAAGLLYPVGAKDVQAVHNFGSTVAGTPGAPKNSATGLQGTYPLYTEAYQRTARKLGILPRELQSITWEGIKSLMGDEKKTPELKNKVRDIWDEVSMGALTPEEARAKIKSAANGFSKPAWMSDEEWEKTGAEGDDTSFMGVDDTAGSGQLTQTGWISPKGEMLPIGDNEAHEDAAVRMKLSGDVKANRASEHFDAAMENGYIRAKVFKGHEASFNAQTLENRGVLEKAIKNLPPNIDTVRVEIMKPYKYAAGSPDEVMGKIEGAGHAPGFDPSFLGGKE